MAFIQSRSTDDGTTNTATSLAFDDVDLTPGTGLVAAVMWKGTAVTCTVADSANGAWTPLGSPQTGTGGQAEYRLQGFLLTGNGSSSKSTVTATTSVSTERRALSIAEYSDADSLEGSVSYANAAGITVSCPAKTPSLASDQVVAFVAPQFTVNSVAAPFTAREAASHRGFADVDAPTAGSVYQAAYTISQSGDVITGALILAAPTGGGGGTATGGTVPSRLLLGVGV